MMHRPNIDHFRLWQVDPDEEQHKLLPWLYCMLKNAALYFGLDTDRDLELAHRVSFRKALQICSADLHLKLMPQLLISKEIIGLPIIARDKKRDWPVLLLPHGHRHFFVLTDANHREIMTIDDAAGRYDHVIYLLMTAQNHKKSALSKNGIPSLLPLWVVMIFSLVFLGLFTALGATISILLSDYALENKMPMVFSLVAITLVLALIGAQWHWLTIKNFLVAYFLVIDEFFRRVFFLSEDDLLAINKSTLSRLMIEARSSCNKYFFHRLAFFIFAMGILLFLVWSFFLWGFSATFILATACALMQGSAFYMDKKRRALFAIANTTFDNIMNVLDHFRVSLAALNGLKASSPLTHHLLREKDQLNAVTLRISSIDFLRKAGVFFLPAFFVLVLAIFIRFVPEPQTPKPYQRAALVAVVLAIGYFIARVLKCPRVNIDPFVEIKKRWQEWPVVVKTRVEPVNIQGLIELDNVSFAYKNNGAMIVKNCYLTIKAHEFHVLYGPAGVGKSTLIKILLGILDPNDGHVVIDGQDMRSLEKSSLRRHFGVVFEESKLFAGTVLDNIVCGRDISPISLKNMLLSHEIFDCLIDMPMGMNTYVFWHTKNLSRFEKSIILLARALVHEPKILFVDDLLIGMSHHHQALMLDYLHGLKMTRVLTSYEKIQSSVAINVNVLT